MTFLVSTGDAGFDRDLRQPFGGMGKIGLARSRQPAVGGGVPAFAAVGISQQRLGGDSGSAPHHAVRRPSRASSAATLDSAPPGRASSVAAISRRAPTGTLSRSIVSPIVVRS